MIWAPIPFNLRTAYRNSDAGTMFNLYLGGWLTALVACSVLTYWIIKALKGIMNAAYTDFLPKTFLCNVNERTHQSSYKLDTCPTTVSARTDGAEKGCCFSIFLALTWCLHYHLVDALFFALAGPQTCQVFSCLRRAISHVRRWQIL